MADKTKAELEADIVALKAQLADVPDISHYESEIDRLTRLNKEIVQEKDEFKIRLENDVREREIIAEDRRKADEAKAAQFKKLKIDQSEHTRFRIYGRPPAGQRDIFGDPTSVVVNLGVELNRYTGGLFVPLPVIIEIGQSIGMLTREQATELKTELSNTAAQVESAATLATELRFGIEKLVDRFYSDLDTVVSDVSDSGSESESGNEIAGQASDAGVGEESAGIPSGSDNSESDDGINGHEPVAGGFFGNLR